MGKYEELSRKALEALGGVENITHVTHCATRLRISYARKSVVNEEGLKDLPGSAGIVNKDKQIQIIIGPGVHDAYEEFLEISGWREGGAVAAEEEEETGPKNAMYYLNKFGNFVAPIFMPVVPAMITGGMILAIKNLLVNYFGMGVDSGTAQLMLMIFDAGFAFLPVYVGYTLASQLKMQPIMGRLLRRDADRSALCDRNRHRLLRHRHSAGFLQLDRHSDRAGRLLYVLCPEGSEENYSGKH